MLFSVPQCHSLAWLEEPSQAVPHNSRMRAQRSGSFRDTAVLSPSEG